MDHSGRQLATFWLLGLALGSAVPGPASAERHVAIVVDTSNSMRSNDRQRYTMQLSQIVSDLLAAGDELTVVRMGSGRCQAGASSSLALRLDAGDRAGFKQRLDAHTRFNTGTHYAAAIRTAIEALGLEPDPQRMLLILADSGGLGRCSEVLTRDLLELHGSGATIAAVNLGSSGGAFDTNPAFDLTTAARDAEQMVEAVAEIYQRFLGAKRVQTGRVAAVIEVEIAPYVEEAFLVVAADGPLRELAQAAGNPRAQAVELNHLGGGQAVGVDDRTRVYRIARLERPAAGRWSFHVPGLQDPAGWMLLQDSALGARLVSPGTVAQGVATRLEVELFDRSTGQRIADTSAIPDLEVTLEIDGQPLSFRDDGTGGDLQAGDGILTATTTLGGTGSRQLPIRIGSDFLDRSQSLEVEVVEAAWALRVTSPPAATVAQPVTLSVALEAVGARDSLAPPERVGVSIGGGAEAAVLRDDGEAGDQLADDGIYSGVWTPAAIGAVEIGYTAHGGSLAPPASRTLEVTGSLDLGPAVAVDLGAVASRSGVLGCLDMNNAAVRGVYDITVSSNFRLGRSVLEIDFGNGWQRLDETSQTLRLAETGDRSWPLRLRVGACPESHPAGVPFEISIEAAGASGAPQRLVIPLRVEVLADSWLKCWWPLLAMVLGTLACGLVIHGFWSPSRFAPRLGLVLSPEEDLAEGFFHPIRAQRGSGSGFYRDARIYLHPDFRLSRQSRGAIARLRADGQQVRIRPIEETTVWRQTADEEWRQLPGEETTARFGVVYKDALGALFFELRNG